MGADHLTSILIEYRYWILIPLTFIEGPIVAFVAGTMASLGYFNVYILGGLFLVRDIAVDLACYYLGYFGAQKAWVRRLLGRMGVTEEHLEGVRVLWHEHGGKTMFFSKLSYGVAAGFIVVAGMVKMPIRKFTLYAALVAVAHYGTLLVIGYIFGNAFGATFVGIIEKIPYVIGGATVIIAAYYLFKRYIKSKLVQAEEEAEKK